MRRPEVGGREAGREARRPLVVAVDGGGSRTRLWVLDPEGRLLGRGEAGSSNLTAAGVEVAARAVTEAAERAGLRSAGPGESLEPAGPASPGTTGARGGTGWLDGPVAVVALALAGADREPEAGRMRARVEGLFPGSSVELVHDGVGALLAGTLGGPGLLLLAGTGSLALALGPEGQEVRAGGWGYLLGDEGSGYWIGREAIRAALRAHDGRGPATGLTTVLREAAGLEDVTALVGPVHRGERDRGWIARLARPVVEAADAGDTVAARILDDAAGELALLVRAVLERAAFLAPLETVPVVAAGGLFRLGPSWGRRVAGALAREAPRARLAERVQDPVVGAAYLALRRFHGELPEEVIERLHTLRQGGQGGRRAPAGGGLLQPV
ncbi:hypothetical protein LIP_2436 [Limnochorda pilosa]|uniref:ATPase BadF/BadG/BcrA/BcrD type domain-containing protein n=1 Tax=Limnochorda pilosa TaxID=1555112 RepID=A0A0K2SMP8_LIMPI|nr:hypothetical protein LIP_2436 [Limnochorda pilosa]